jgi:hypothetical protein
MLIKKLLNIYCEPFNSKEKTFMYSNWLNINKNKYKIYQIIEKLSNKSEYILYITIAFKEIYDNLIEINFYNLENFISTCSAFIAILSIYICNNDKIISKEKIDLLIKYVLLYVYIDHTLDTNKEYYIILKKILLKIIKNNLIEKKEYSNLPLHIQKSIEYLKLLFKESPNCIPFILKAADIEFESIDIQNVRHDYLKLCYLKGESSAIAGLSILTDGIIYKGANIVGRLGQLYDDIIDIDIDLKDNILTFPIECLHKNGNIDLSIETFCIEIEKLPSQYSNLIRLILYSLSTFLINNSYISNELRNIIHNYSLLYYTTNTTNKFYFFNF